MEHVDTEARVEYLNLSSADSCCLAEFWSVLKPALPGVLSRFYAHLQKRPETGRFLTGRSTVDRAKSAQTRHWQRLFSGRFDADYLNSVRAIARAHLDLGMEPQWYIGGYAFVLRELHEVAVHAVGRVAALPSGRRRLIGLLSAIDRAVMLDIELTTDAYLTEQRGRHETKLADLADQFERRIVSLTKKVGEASQDLSVHARSLQTDTSETNDQAMSAAAGAEQASVNVRQVADAARELVQSFQEVNRQVAMTRDYATEASRVAGEAEQILSRLSNAAASISGVVELIRGIAGQTNMLALNATIEAARAGDAGRGFAVVAGEVKTLATQTATATDDINRQFEGMQGVANDVADAMGRIVEAVTQASAASETIADAVEEQSAVTQEIGGNVEQAANGATMVSAAIVGVKDSTIRARADADGALTAADQLAEQAREMTRTAEGFAGHFRSSDRPARSDGASG